MPADRAMPPRNQRNSNKATNARNQGDAQSFPPNQQLSNNDSPKQRKKRNQISDQLQQPQQQRQSVFERLGTKNATAPLLRQAKNKKEIKDHIPINEPRKSRRISDSRKAERDLSEGEISQEVGKFKDRQQPIEPKSKTDSSFNKNSVEPIKNITSNSKNTFREESEDAAKEDVVSIQADDDFSLHSDIDDNYPGYLSPPDDGQLPMDQDFIDNHEKISSDSIQGRERIHRNLDRINREHHVPPHKDDRRRIVYDRDSREKLRDERYNRTNVPMRDHRDHRPHEIDRDRRERERQERYNQSILEDKVHFDQRRNDRDRFLRDDRGVRNEHGNRTPTADTSSNSTVRGDTSERLITRRDDRPSNVRQKNDGQNDSTFQDNRNRDRDPGQRNIQQNVQPELDRTEKRKKEESEIITTERKQYLDREQRNDSLQPIQRLPEYRSREKDRDVRQRDEFMTKDNMRLGINRDQERELPNHRDDRATGLPDLYRPSSDHHLRDPDRRPIREFDRNYRDLRGEPIGIDRYRGDYSRDNNQGRDRMLDNHPREIERRLSWDLDNRGGTSNFSDKDQIDHRRERDRERAREVGHKSRSTSAELKVDSHKHLYDFHQREPERRIARDVENDQMVRVNRNESVRRAEIDRHLHFNNNKHHDSSHDFSLDALQREDQDIDLQSKDQIMDDEILPEPWQKCMSRKNKVYYFNPSTRESRWTFPTEEFGKRPSNESESSRQISPSGMSSLNYSTQHRLRRSSNEDDRNIYNGDEDLMEASMEIDEFRMNNRNLREFNNKTGERADLENGVPQTETRTPNDATIETEPGANFIASDEEAWRTEDDMVDDVLADTEPESLFLFR
ncbi:22989_t:CDS:2, partial [Dentiscutata erythropus]